MHSDTLKDRLINIARTGAAVRQLPALPKTRAGSRPADVLLDRYLRRIDPAIAASFTDAQLHAIKQMFNDRRVQRHMVDLRHTFALGGKRYYTVFFFGRDRRIRAQAEQHRDSWLGLGAYLTLALGLLASLFMFVYYLKG